MEVQCLGHENDLRKLSLVVLFKIIFGVLKTCQTQYT